MGEESPTVQAKAWNLLGLALHRSGHAAEAVAAYRKALVLDRDLAVANYNLGCLLYEQGSYVAAVDAFTTYIALQKEPNEQQADAYLRMGSAHLRLSATVSGAERLRQLDGARHDLEIAHRQVPSPETLNGLGLIQWQRNRSSTEAINRFRGALQMQSNYAPALLNMAIIHEYYLNDQRIALQEYRDFLAMQSPLSTPRDLDLATREIQRLSPPPPLMPAPVLAEKPVPAPSKVAPEPPVLKAETNVVKAALTPATVFKSVPSPVKISPVPVPELPVTSVAVAQEPPAPKPAQDLTVVAPSNSVAGATLMPQITNGVGSPKKEGALSKLNPIAWFGTKSKPDTSAVSTVTLLPDSPLPPALETTSRAVAIPTPPAKPVVVTPLLPRYRYAVTAHSVAAGDRVQASKLLAQGLQAQRQENLVQAMDAYRSAIKADPSFWKPKPAMAPSEPASS